MVRVSRNYSLWSQRGISKFFQFVRMHNRELISLLESISSYSTYSEAQVDLGLNNRFFCRARLRLKVLLTVSLPEIRSPTAAYIPIPKMMPVEQQPLRTRSLSHGRRRRAFLGF